MKLTECLRSWYIYIFLDMESNATYLLRSILYSDIVESLRFVFYISVRMKKNLKFE